MNEPKNRLTEKELKLIEDTEAFMDEVYNNPEVADAEPSSELRDRVFAEIRAREAAKKEKEPKVEKFSAEEKELIRLGRIYKKRKRLQKYVVLAAVLILTMAFGMTSIGGPKKVFEMVKSTLMGREQINVDSDDISRTSGMSEEEAYQKIEKAFNFTPVELYYLPDEVEFLEVNIGEEIQAIHVFYGVNDEVKISYFIRPNYRAGSYGKDIEDEFVEEYTRENEYTIIYIGRYMVEGNEERWTVQFEYKETLYTMSITDTTREEVEKIVENLYFS